MRAFLHIGAGKTGTSSIQAALARHREVLHEAGLHYPHGDKGQDLRSAAGGISSGNGTLLARYLFPNRSARAFSREELEAWLDRAVADADGRDIVISNEMLQSIRQPQLQELKELLSARGVETHIIFYMRHVLDWKLSAFAQHVKVGGLMRFPPEERTPDGYIASTTCAWPRQLGMIADTIGRDRMICRLYDAERTNLAARFLDGIRPGLSAAVGTQVSQISINRSPNLAEFALFAAANDQPDARKVCGELVDALLNAPSVVDSPGLGITQATFDAFAARMTPIVEKLSASYLPAETPLKVTSGRIPIGEPQPVSVEQIAQVAAAAFTYLSRDIRSKLEKQRKERNAPRAA